MSFQSMISRQSINFKAFIIAFNETYASDWSSEEVYGRMDPIMLFKNTKRVITLGLKIPAASISEGFENLGKVGELTKMLYPSYSNINDASTITQSPLIRMRVMNLAHAVNDSVGLSDAGASNYKYTEYASVGSPNTPGLLGAITSVAINHNLENPDIGVLEMAAGTVLPKLIELNVEFAVLHEHALGWDSINNESFGTAADSDAAGFPYGINLAESLNPAIPDNTATPSRADNGPDINTDEPSDGVAARLLDATIADDFFNNTQAFDDNENADLQSLGDLILESNARGFLSGRQQPGSRRSRIAERTTGFITAVQRRDGTSTSQINPETSTDNSSEVESFNFQDFL